MNRLWILAAFGLAACSASAAPALVDTSNATGGTDAAPPVMADNDAAEHTSPSQPDSGTVTDPPDTGNDPPGMEAGQDSDPPSMEAGQDSDPPSMEAGQDSSPSAEAGSDADASPPAPDAGPDSGGTVDAGIHDAGNPWEAGNILPDASNACCDYCQSQYTMCESSCTVCSVCQNNWYSCSGGCLSQRLGSCTQPF